MYKYKFMKYCKKIQDQFGGDIMCENYVSEELKKDTIKKYDFTQLFEHNDGETIIRIKNPIEILGKGAFGTVIKGEMYKKKSNVSTPIAIKKIDINSYLINRIKEDNKDTVKRILEHIATNKTVSWEQKYDDIKKEKNEEYQNEIKKQQTDICRELTLFHKLDVSTNLYSMNYYGYNISNNIIYIFTEYINGETLYNYLYITNKEIKPLYYLYNLYKKQNKENKNYYINNDGSAKQNINTYLSYSTKYVNIVKQLLHGLYYLHQNGIYHRDIKPENIMVYDINSNNIKVKYIDFGFSCLKDLSCINVPATGTYKYISPEFSAHINRQYSHDQHLHHYDLWALGCTIYELFTKKTVIPETLQKWEDIRKEILGFDDGIITRKLSMNVFVDNNISSVRMRKIISNLMKLDTNERKIMLFNNINEIPITMFDIVTYNRIFYDNDIYCYADMTALYLYSYFFDLQKEMTESIKNLDKLENPVIDIYVVKQIDSVLSTFESKPKDNTKYYDAKDNHVFTITKKTEMTFVEIKHKNIVYNLLSPDSLRILYQDKQTKDLIEIINNRLGNSYLWNYKSS